MQKKTTSIHKDKPTISQGVKNTWESKKLVKKVVKTPERPKKADSKKPTGDKKTPVEKKEEEVTVVEEGKIEYSQDRKGNTIVTQQAYKPARNYNLGGRPTKYREEYADQLLDYFSAFTQEVYVDREYYDIKGKSREDTIERTPVDADGYKRHLVRKETHKVISSKFPTIERFAFMLNVSRVTLHEWANAVYDDKYKIVKDRGKLKYPKFSYAYARAREIQESILIEWAMDGTFNSQFAIFLAKNRFWYKDKTEVEQTSTGILGIVGLSEEKKESLINVIASKQWKVIELPAPNK